MDQKNLLVAHLDGHHYGYQIDLFQPAQRDTAFLSMNHVVSDQ